MDAWNVMKMVAQSAQHKHVALNMSTLMAKHAKAAQISVRAAVLVLEVDVWNVERVKQSTRMANVQNASLCLEVDVPHATSLNVQMRNLVTSSWERMQFSAVNCLAVNAQSAIPAAA